MLKWNSSKRVSQTKTVRNLTLNFGIFFFFSKCVSEKIFGFELFNIYDLHIKSIIKIILVNKPPFEFKYKLLTDADPNSRNDSGRFMMAAPRRPWVKTLSSPQQMIRLLFFRIQQFHSSNFITFLFFPPFFFSGFSLFIYRCYVLSLRARRF